jgi:tellurite resistance protein TerC
MIENLGNHPTILIVFSVLILGMLVLDLGVFNKNAHRVSSKEAATWTLVWISLSMLFSVFILKQTSVEKFSQFQSAYWIEKALSVDNLFVFILVFNFFKVPEESHHKVLFWGIIGALFMRALFIFSGVGLINYTYLPAINLFNKDVSINLVLSGFGLFLIYAGIKSWFADDDDEEQDFSKSKGARLIHKLFKVSDHFDKDKFFTVENGVKIATPLLVVVGVIEFTDLLFAVDSIPAIFSIAPDDPFILYTSNIFAILGLRSMYFLLSNFIHMFSKLKYGLAIILTFIGLKMVISPFYHIDTLVSLLIVLSVLVGSVVLSILSPKTEQ